MSRIGNTNINIPNGVTVDINKQDVTVKGSKGELSYTMPRPISIEINENQLTVKRSNNEGQTKAYHGLVRSLLQNMIIGVSQGYTKKLELVGTGYRAKKQGKDLNISVGYSHPVIYKASEGVTLDMEGETVIVISGIDKQVVGQAAAEIRAIRKPEPYKGKGIRYQGEYIRRKAGKAAKVGA
jgi:large subunit ribosomal protein L6